ncbi:hypothetical protein Zmor_004236 [Zophobas morio]|jgi:DNA polymerase sigma|uniref:PAP-associated domain-containing protein n=2 Tax=Zophobas morio TaxID=2755281 RepID=A0AA38HI68_9CUCU|nr:hypothetical protein Zmor_004236 [Zophobas morio]
MEYIKLNKSTRKLIIGVKDWTKRHNISLSGYSIALLVIYYLQSLQVLPFLQPPLGSTWPHSPRNMIEGWDCTFKSSDELALDCQHNLLSYNAIELYCGFLRFYGAEFPYKDRFVCIRDHDRNLLSSKNSPANLIDKVTVEGECWTMKKSAIVIQDPFELCHNITHSFKEESLNKFKEELITSYLSMLEAVTLSTASFPEKKWDEF